MEIAGRAFIGQAAAELMDDLAQAYGEDCEVTVAAIVCEVRKDGSLEIVVRSTDDRWWVQAALLWQGIETVSAEEDDE